MTIDETVSPTTRKSIDIKPVDFIPLYCIETYAHRNFDSQTLGLSKKEELKDIGMRCYLVSSSFAIAIAAAKGIVKIIDYVF